MAVFFSAVSGWLVRRYVVRDRRGWIVLLAFSVNVGTVTGATWLVIAPQFPTVGWPVASTAPMTSEEAEQAKREFWRVIERATEKSLADQGLLRLDYLQCATRRFDFAVHGERPANVLILIAATTGVLVIRAGEFPISPELTADFRDETGLAIYTWFFEKTRWSYRVTAKDAMTVWAGSKPYVPAEGVPKRQ